MHLYLVTNTMTGTQYVGKTIRPLPARWKEHLYRAHRGSESHLHRAIRKYGADAFKIQAFPFEPQDERSLNEWEKFLIAALACRSVPNLPLTFVKLSPPNVKPSEPAHNRFGPRPVLLSRDVTFRLSI